MCRRRVISRPGALPSAVEAASDRTRKGAPSYQSCYGPCRRAPVWRARSGGSIDTPDRCLVMHHC